MLKVAWSPLYNHPVPEGHRFPMLKYDLIPEQLLYEGVLTKVNFLSLIRSMKSISCGLMMNITGQILKD